MKENTMADKKSGKSQVGHAADWLEDLMKRGSRTSWTNYSKQHANLSCMASAGEILIIIRLVRVRLLWLHTLVQVQSNLISSYYLEER